MSDIVSGAEPEIRQKARLSKIWIVPIVAALIGLGMVYNSWQNRGINIIVSFETAQGLVANKTVVKYRNVDVGMIKKIGFNPARDRILLDIEIDKGMSDLLNQETQFWVVKPRIGAQGVSGIGTLLSGAYIELSPGQSGESQFEYVGLELPPITSPNADGLHLDLVSKGGKPLNIGDSVIYRGFEVGQVESSEFDPDQRTANYGIFINAPYDALVTTNTIFWNAGGLTVTTSTEGVRVDMASVETLVSGGIQFDVPEGTGLGDRIANSQTFVLYDSPQELEESRVYEYFEYAILVEDSVRGLHKGAPVEYRGIRIGTVKSPFLYFDDPTEADDNDPRIPIIVKIEPGRMYQNEANVEEFRALIEQGIRDGLVATIETANLLTGSLKISLNFGGQPPEKLETYGQYPVIPSKREGFASMAEKIDGILSKIDALPFDQTVTGANRALTSADETLISMNRSLQELEATLKGLQPDSEIYQSLNESVAELQSTLRTMQPVLQELSNKPNSLLFGRAKQPDPEPSPQ